MKRTSGHGRSRRQGGAVEPTPGDAYGAAEAAIASIGPLRELAAEVRRYPVALLRTLCAEYRRRGTPVPDYLLSLAPYLGETALRALVLGGLAERVDDARFAIHAFVPTAQGLALAEGIEREMTALRGGSPP